MIRPSYALKLARTKLKTRKILLAITIFISSLLFGLIIAGTIVITGLSRSTDSYLKTALDDKYLVSVSPIIPNDVAGLISIYKVPSSDLKTHLLDLQKEYTNNQKKLAKQYGVAFDDSSVESVLMPDPFGGKDKLGKVKEVINRESPVYQMYIDEIEDEWLTSTKSTATELRKITSPRGATDYYQNRYASISYVDANFISGDKEDLTKVVNPDIPSTDAIKNSSYVFTDQSLIKRYILPENDLRRKNNTAIPVVTTKEEVVKSFGKELGLSKEPNDPSEKIIWMKSLQEKVNGHTYQACYRNESERNLIQEAMVQNQTASKNDESQKPNIAYTLPNAICAPVTISKDNRTAEQKSLDSKNKLYQKATGRVVEPKTQLLTFQIVGIMPDVSMMLSDSSDFSSLINSLLSSKYQNGAYITNQLYNKIPTANRHEDILKSSTDSFGVSNKKFAKAGVVPSIVAFSSAPAAKEFMNSHTCPGYDSEGCKKLWTSQVYGPVNYLLLEDINNKVAEIVRIVLPIAVILAAIVMSFTMARVIIDSRHETAIFRALGAKRKDIMGIYIIYGILVSALIALCSLIIGFAMSLTAQLILKEDIANYAKVSYGVFNEPDTFTLIGVDAGLLSAAVITILIVGVVAIVPSLLRNVRRNPIRDMREE